jgi:hypothetical protein
MLDEVPARAQLPPAAQPLVQRSTRYESIVAPEGFVHDTRTEFGPLFVATVVSGAGGVTVTVSESHEGLAGQPFTSCTE